MVAERRQFERETRCVSRRSLKSLRPLWTLRPCLTLGSLGTDAVGRGQIPSSFKSSFSGFETSSASQTRFSFRSQQASPSAPGARAKRVRLEREAKAVAAFNHPNTVTVHSVEESDGVHSITNVTRRPDAFSHGDSNDPWYVDEEDISVTQTRKSLPGKHRRAPRPVSSGRPRVLDPLPLTLLTPRALPE